ncbi:GGDEF domain-containing protein [Desulfosporosinus sp.]|uniref:GGDEF domain-containing protein n=1 Tax=Desulfosporosinus sp. TaxID=157907 RepID=UPI000E99ABC7|nr:GGDEF domain-containing protein [Desulfosporosinus sp.]MBC2723954.1 GGDEF domain-containing protein [Desulfosporosinus sp.]MBC2725315.1 GGDEF domain-containing protein [Desulfosporosinus sp.]HBV85647.1 GGDEF domain-containing protein [Desulfosporosinus sp.]
MIRVWLFFAMVIISIMHSALTHFMVVPFFNNFVAKCLVLGIVFGLINFLVAELFSRRLDKLTKINKQLRVKLKTDNLTGVLNRRAFDEDIKNLEHNGSYALIFIDIDNFRDFNNRFGHDVGDSVLVKVGQAIQASVRTTDRVYRYGGEEIVLLLRDCNKANSWKMAETIRSKISELDNGSYPQITISLGVSSYPEDGETIHDLIVASDQALLRAKQSGKNCTILC